MNLTLMAAADLEWGIGIDGKLPWLVPEDLKRFKARTMGKAVVMGRKTVETLPSTLPGRRILTLTRNPIGFGSHDLGSLLLHLASEPDEVIVAGGGEVYRALLPYCAKAEITRVKAVHDCDTRLLNLSEHGWTLVRSEPLSEVSDLEEWRRT
ncbi:dihydrofolate reductase [Rhizobium sp. BK176]|uniref:dihydrofolate reductase n=1 Tax=Rhizobium sp. BK176 TaxID=2587071 RepID=UPI00216A7E9E|nr:dihydrofolate reductase [Rhizobium sp. BK176]MCS4089556.1 dihydrofolate reductase [Rhizobium sp. BK176]